MEENNINILQNIIDENKKYKEENEKLKEELEKFKLINNSDLFYDNYKNFNFDEKDECLKELIKIDDTLFLMKHILSDNYKGYRKQYYKHRYKNDKEFNEKIKEKAKKHYYKKKMEKNND